MRSPPRQIWTELLSAWKKVKSMKFTEGMYFVKKGFRAIGPAHAYEVVRREREIEAPVHCRPLAGDDRKRAWADAVLECDTVVVSSPAVPKPVAVRYACAMNPEGCNLYNKAGLPASPFRTDNW